MIRIKFLVLFILTAVIPPAFALPVPTEEKKISQLKGIQVPVPEHYLPLSQDPENKDHQIKHMSALSYELHPLKEEKLKHVPIFKQEFHDHTGNLPIGFVADGNWKKDQPSNQESQAEHTPPPSRRPSTDSTMTVTGHEPASVPNKDLPSTKLGRSSRVTKIRNVAAGALAAVKLKKNGQ